MNQAEHRRLIMDALKAGAYDCPGDCGLSEEECREKHPVQWAGTALEGTPNEVVFIEGPTGDIADLALKAFEEAGLTLAKKGA